MSESTQRTASTVAVIGAGPVGLAAAAHLVERGLTPIVLEAGTDAGAAVAQWGHVRLFSPWRFNIDSAARRLLEDTDWTAPDPETLPTGAELIERYLAPLAATDALAPHLRFGTRVAAVTRQGVDKTRTVGREGRPYLVRTVNGDGESAEITADAVIDASGTWGHPNPLGTAGLVAAGEADAAQYLAGPLPDVLGAQRERFAGKHTLVAGMGHSAANSLLALAELADAVPGGEITWVVRGDSVARLYGGGDADALPARGALGTRLKDLVTRGRIRLIRQFTIDRFAPAETGPVTVHGHTPDEDHKFDVDAVIGATGFRPDLEVLREVRLDLDPALEAPSALAPLIDPNFHSCGTVPPHGEKDLAHPDENFYIAGMKSYGRAPTFLMATGYEQVRSIAAAISGDREAADSVQLELPETGVCSTDLPSEHVTGDGGRTAQPIALGQGLSTGVLHGHSGEQTAPQSSCCGAKPETAGC